MSERGFSIPVLTLTFLALVVLATLSWWAAHLTLGIAQGPIAVIIACAKALLVMTVFMGLAKARPSIIISLLVAALLIAIFIALVWMDVGLRPHHVGNSP